MAGTGTKLLVFLIISHTLLFGAQSAGTIDNQQGENPNKQFVDQFRGDNLTDEAAVEDDSNIIDGTFGPAVKSLGFIDAIAGILKSPYTLVAGSGLPTEIIMVIQAIIGLMEAAVIAGFLRGWEL